MAGSIRLAVTPWIVSKIKTNSTGGRKVLNLRKARATGGTIATRRADIGQEIAEERDRSHVTSPVIPKAQQARPTGTATIKLALTFTTRYSEMARLIDRVILRIPWARSGEKWSKFAPAWAWRTEAGRSCRTPRRSTPEKHRRKRTAAPGQFAANLTGKEGFRLGRRLGAAGMLKTGTIDVASLRMWPSSSAWRLHVAWQLGIDQNHVAIDQPGQPLKTQRDDKGNQQEREDRPHAPPQPLVDWQEEIAQEDRDQEWAEDRLQPFQQVKAGGHNHQHQQGSATHSATGRDRMSGAAPGSDCFATIRFAWRRASCVRNPGASHIHLCTPPPLAVSLRTPSRGISQHENAWPELNPLTISSLLSTCINDKSSRHSPSD